MGANSQSGSGVGSYLSRWFLSRLAGLAFGGYRDYYKVYGYKRGLRYEDMIARLTRQDIVKTCMYKPAEAIWANPPIVHGNKAFEEAWEKMIISQNLWATMLRIDKILACDPYAVLLLGMPGKSDSAVTEAKEIAYMQPYGAHSARVRTFNGDTSQKRFGLPEGYSIDTRAKVTVDVDWSRAIHFTNELVEDNLESAPRMLVGWNLFDDLLKIAGGSAETFWLTSNKGMQVDVDKDMELSTDDADALSDELDEYQHQLRRMIRTRGVTIEDLGGEVVDPSGAFKVTIALLASTYGIPQRVLMGSEAGALASEQDRANWAEVVQNRRETFAEPYILKPFISRMGELGVLPTVKPADLSFEWPNAFHLSPLEKAQTMAQSARAIVNLSRQSQFGHPVSTEAEARLICGLPAESAVPLPEVTDIVAGAQKSGSGGGSTTTKPPAKAEDTPGHEGDGTTTDKAGAETDSSTGATTTTGSSDSSKS